MSDQVAPQRAGAIPALARILALLGGGVLLLAAGLTTVSVTLRWLTDQPIRGDFELVSIASGVGVFGCLAYGTLQRTNILVDSFSSWLPTRLNSAIDAFWTLVWAVLVLWLAERMVLGAWDSFRSNTTTIGLLGVSYWWAIGIGAFCFAATGIVALWWVPQQLRGRD